MQGSATFFALRMGFSLAIFCGPALNKLMNVWHMQIYYNSQIIKAVIQWEIWA